MRCHGFVVVVAVLLVAMTSHAGNDVFSSGGSTSERESSSQPLATTPAPTVLLPQCAPVPLPLPGDADGGDGKNDEEVSLLGYAPRGAMNVTVVPNTANNVSSEHVYAISPCDAVPLANCSNMIGGGNGDQLPMGYAALHVDGKCTEVYTQVKSPSVFDPTINGFTVVVQTADLIKTLTIVVQCGKKDEDDDGTTGVATGAPDVLTLIISSYKVCPSKIMPLMALGQDQCEVEFKKYNHYYRASLLAFSRMGNKTAATTSSVTTMSVQISPCEMKDFSNLTTPFTGCPKTLGYMAFMDQTNTCVVLDSKMAIYDPNTLTFNMTFSRLPPTDTPKDAVASNNRRVVIVKCGSEDSAEGIASDGEDGAYDTTITYSSKQACGTEYQPPGPPPKADALSDVDIISIVCGSIALVIMGLMLLRWHKSKKYFNEEGEYKRV